MFKESLYGTRRYWCHYMRNTCRRMHWPRTPYTEETSRREKVGGKFSNCWSKCDSAHWQQNSCLEMFKKTKENKFANLQVNSFQKGKILSIYICMSFILMWSAPDTSDIIATFIDVTHLAVFSTSVPRRNNVYMKHLESSGKRLHAWS